MFAMPRMTPFMKGLLGLVFGVYVLQLVLENWVGVPVFDSLAFEPNKLGPWSALRVIAYPFVSAASADAALRIMLALLFLWWAAGAFEMRFGWRRTIQLMAFATVFTAGCTGLIAALLPAHHPLFGATVWYSALWTAVAYSLPRDAQLSLFGLLTLKRNHLLMLFLAFPVLNFLGSRDFVALVADLASMAAGVLFILWMRRPPRAARPKKKTARSSGFRVIQGGGDDDAPKYLN